MQKISFKSDGYTLSGHLSTPPSEPKQFGFLLIQGWTGHQNLKAAQMLCDMGFTALTYDMRGNGESEGDIAQFSRADFVKDAGVAYDFLRQQVGIDTPIAVIGSSFGSYTAVLLTRDRPVFALSLRVPANYPDKGYDEPQMAQHDRSDDFKTWRDKPQTYEQNHTLKALHDFQGKVQIIEAGADELVPHQMVENYVKAVSNPEQLDYQVLEGTPHRLENDTLQAKYEALLKAWVENSLL